nr:hypothetical protein [uncultured Mucilaginibacter sp.]
MKKIVLILLIAGWGTCFAQKKADFTATDHISKKFTLTAAAAKTTFGLYNTWGSITVEGYNGNEVIIEVEQTIHAKTPEDLEKGKREFKADFIQTADSIIAYTAKPINNRPEFRNERMQNHEWPGYYVELNYTVKVPNNINLHANTVNNGNINISNVYGLLKLNNVNGLIAIVNAKGTTQARTVNGPITANYLVAPPEGCSYSTINGKVEVTYPAAYAGDVQYKSFNGKFYTDFDNVGGVATQPEVIKNKANGGTTYRLNKNSRLRIGSGGKLTTFETLNGNIYLKKS